MDYQSIMTFIMEMAGTIAFAASGAMVGVERNMDIFGVSVLGVATAVGGGMIRDVVLGLFHRLYLQIRYMHLYLCLPRALFSLFFILRENFWKDTGVRHTISLCWCWILWDLVFLR